MKRTNKEFAASLPLEVLKLLAEDHPIKHRNYKSENWGAPLPPEILKALTEVPEDS